MNRDEKQTWGAQLGFEAAGLLFFLGGAIGSGWEYAPFCMGFWMFVIAFSISFTVWLFRVTYEAGRSRR